VSARRCSRCGQRGHTRKTCERREQEALRATERLVGPVRDAQRDLDALNARIAELRARGAWS
jgi:predicted ATPase with chaperone activity